MTAVNVRANHSFEMLSATIGGDMESRDRILWVDTAKCICIFFVITSHLESCTPLLTRFFTPFFLTGFLFLSGYCYRHRDCFSGLIRKKAAQLLIPWLLWGLLSLTFHQLFSGMRRNSGQIMGFADELKWFFLQVRGINDGPWFFAMLFVSFIPFFFLIRTYERNKNRRRAVRMLLIALGVLYLAGKLYTQLVPPFSYGTNALPWHLESLPGSLFFMFLGYLYRDSGKSGVNTPILSHAWIPVLFLILVFTPLAAGADGILPVPAGQFYEAVSECFGVLSLLWAARHLKPNACTCFIGQNTLLYYPMHVYVYTLLNYVLRRLLPVLYPAILAGTAASSAFALAEAFLISCLLIPPAKFINRYMPILAGKKAGRSVKNS